MPDWVQDAVIYQVNLRSLAAREPRNPVEALVGLAGDGVSPLSYLAENIDLLMHLGINVFYLLPPYRIGQAARKGIGSPYSAADFTSVDPEYGSSDELADVVRRAHAAGAKVIFDITPNHTSRDNVWITRHPEYYVRDEHGVPQVDWDWSDTAKLDYTNPALRVAMIDVFSHWLGFLGDGDGIDGFRLDMAHIINDLSFWDEALPVLRERFSHKRLLFLAESYGFENNVDLFRRGMDAAYDDDWLKCGQFFYARDEQGRSVVALDPLVDGHDGFADKLAAFNAGGVAAAFTHVLQSYEDVVGDLQQPHWVARYTDNHDEGRGVFRFGPGATHAMARLFFMSGHCIPFLMCGQEFGAENRPSIHERMGICDKGYRKHCAHPPDAVPGIEFEGNLFARGARERSAWYQFYRDLIDLRLENPELRTGSFVPVDAGENASESERTVVCFARETAAQRVVCAVNMGDAPRVLENTGLFDGDVLYGELADGELGAFAAVAVRTVLV